MDIDWDGLRDLAPAELQTAIPALADVAMSELSDEAEDEQAAALPEPVRTIWLLSWLDYEISQGPMLAYFFNSHGRFASDAAAALERIGALRMAAVLQRAIAVHDSTAVSWATRRSDLTPRGEHEIVRPYVDLPGVDALENPTNEYWSAADEEDWGNLLDDFLARSVIAQGNPT